MNIPEEWRKCLPENRRAWKKPSGLDGSVRACMSAYLNKYAEFAGAERVPDRLLNDLFYDTKALIAKARKQHRETHLQDISSGQSLWVWAKKRTGCDPERLVKIESLRDGCGSRGCFPASSRWRSIKGFKELCEKMGCSEEEDKRLWAEGDSLEERCGVDRSKIMDMHHYHVDKTLRHLERAAEFALERMDKVEVIEGFIQLSHHGGPVLEFGCSEGKIEEASGPTREAAIDTLDCLAGIDWEPVTT